MSFLGLPFQIAFYTVLAGFLLQFFFFFFFPKVACRLNCFLGNCVSGVYVGQIHLLCF
jgi:hypothetical protein